MEKEGDKFISKADVDWPHTAVTSHLTNWELFLLTAIQSGIKLTGNPFSLMSKQAFNYTMIQTADPSGRAV